MLLRHFLKAGDLIKIIPTSRPCGWDGRVYLILELGLRYEDDIDDYGETACGIKMLTEDGRVVYNQLFFPERWKAVEL